MKRRAKILKSLKYNNIFSKIFFGLLLLSLSVLAIFYLFVNTLSTRYHREQLAASNLNLISQAASSMDITLDSLSQVMRQILWNRDFVEYMINPRSEDGTLVYRISLQLRSSVTGSALVKKAVFFAALSDTVVQDTLQPSNRDSFADQALLEACNQPFSSVFDAQSRTQTAIVYYQNRLFIIQQLNIASPIGTLVCEVDLDMLKKQFFNLSAEQNNIDVLDAQGIPIFISEENTYVDLNNDAFITYENLSARAATQTTGYYRYTAPSSGWTFLLPIDSVYLMPPVGQILSAYTPVFIVVFLFSLFFAWFVGRATYRPINNLMQMVNKPGFENISRTNEADFLEYVYFAALEGRTKMEDIVKSIAPEIIESMLKSLISGRSFTEERISEILSGLGNPFGVRGRFYVVACAMTPTQAREISDTELNLHLLAVRNLVGDLQSPACSVYDIRTEKQLLALVCCSSAGHTIGEITQEYHRIKRALLRNAELLPFEVQCACGNIYENLCDIRISYNEAVKKIQQMQYNQPDFLETKPGTELTGVLELNEKYFCEQAKELTKLAAGSLWPQAQAKLMLILRDISDKSVNMEDYKVMIQKLIEETLERINTYPLAKEDLQVLNCCRMRPETADLNQKEDLAKLVQEDYQLIFKMIATYNRKNSYKYIETAKAYIADNYMDSDLSLYKVSDYVGISSPYLSELFNEIVNEKFSTYLAAFRVEKARQLFCTTQLTSKEISLKCGFNSVQNFIRVFKKYTGQTPGHYREGIEAKEVACAIREHY